MQKMPSFVVEESLNSVRVFWLKRDELIEALKKRAQEVGKSDPKVVKIVLFGSLAEGRAVPNSDADVLILLKKDDRPIFDRISEYLEKFDIGFPVEVFPYTVDERNPIVENALKRGIVLFKREVE